MPGDAQRDAVAAAVLDVGQDCCAHAREAFGIEAEPSSTPRAAGAVCSLLVIFTC